MSSTQFIPDPDGDNLADIASVSSNSQGSVRVVPDSVEPASGVCSPAVNHVAFEAIFPPNSVSSKPESANSRAHSVRVSYPKPIACLSFLDGPAGDIFAAFCSAAAIVTDVMLYPTTAFQMTRTVHAIPLFPYYQTVYVLSYIGFVYWYWRHLETQVLLRKLLLTFESFYLCLFAVTWMFATTLHIEPEFETRGMPVNMDYTRYITARVNALLVFSMSFVSVLCCDALVRVSVAIKVWVCIDCFPPLVYTSHFEYFMLNFLLLIQFHFLFVVFAVNIWSSVNGVDSHAESPTTICLGSTPLSCFSTHSMRVAPLIFISLYLVRNIFVMTSHYFRPWLSPMSSHVLMTVKSGVSFTLLDPVDEMNPSNTSMEQRQHSRIDQMSQSIDPGTSGYELKLAKLSASARVSVTPQLASGLPHAIEMIDANRSHEHNSDSEVSMVPGSAAAALPAEPASVPSQIQVVSASSSNSHDNMLVDDAKTQSLTLQFVSAFNNDFDTDAAPRKSCLGNMMFEAWQNLYLQVAFFILCLAIGVLCYFGEVHCFFFSSPCFNSIVSQSFDLVKRTVCSHALR
jgi:hypothetical protein